MYNMKKGGGGGSGTYPLLKTNNFGKIHDNASQFKDNLPNIYVTWLNQQLSEIMFIRPLNLMMFLRVLLKPSPVSQPRGCTFLLVKLELFSLPLRQGLFNLISHMGLTNGIGFWHNSCWWWLGDDGICEVLCQFDWIFELVMCFIAGIGDSQPT